MRVVRTVMGRNTQGVRLMNLDKGDTLVAIKRIPKIEGAAERETADGSPQTAEEEQSEAQS